ESSQLIPFASGIALTVQRLDRNTQWSSVAPDLVLVYDELRGELRDFDEATPGVQGYELPGRWPRQWRDLDQGATTASRSQILLLNTGILELDLEAGASQWRVAPERFEAVGIVDERQPQSFDLNADGTHAYVAAYTADFEQVEVFEFSLQDDSPGKPISSGLHSAGRSLEIIDDVLWFADTTRGGEGLRALSLEGEALFEVYPT